MKPKIDALLDSYFAVVRFYPYVSQETLVAMTQELPSKLWQRPIAKVLLEQTMPGQFRRIRYFKRSAATAPPNCSLMFFIRVREEMVDLFVEGHSRRVLRHRIVWISWHRSEVVVGVVNVTLWHRYVLDYIGLDGVLLAV